MTKHKIIFRDIIAVSVCSIICGILFITNVISMNQLFLGVVGISLTFITISILLYFKSRIISFIKEEWSLRISLLWNVIKVLHKKYDERLIETVFEYFVHYYNRNVSEISQDREFPKEEFPEGSFELIKVYIYITQLRKRNKKLISKIDYSSSPILFNMRFKHLKFKINKNFELQIYGDNDTDDTMTFTQYTSFATKVHNALYDLDTQVASWLIKNRNHFGF